MKIVSSATSFSTNYLPFIFVGTFVAIAVVVFTVTYFVRKRLSNAVRALEVFRQIIEDNETSEMDEVSNTGSEGNYNPDEFDLISLHSDNDNDEVTTVKVESKELSFISSEEDGPRSAHKMDVRASGFELTSITSCY